MPMYEFKCKNCRRTTTLLENTAPRKCAYCDHKSVIRVYSFSPKTSFQPHYNTALGRWVTSEKDFKDGLKSASDAASVRTGLDTNYVPVEWQDKETFRATEDGMDNYHRSHYNNTLAQETDADYIA